ncbi:MAG TPA: GAF domain-containing protein [Acidimicrobiales bacterium]|nr:GAF domain-containing protein [Acidimicrobiales bacterium]
MTRPGRGVPTVIGAFGVCLAAVAVAVHLVAGLGLPPDVARGLSVQLPVVGIGLVLVACRPGNRLGPLAVTAGAVLALGLLSAGILRSAAAGRAVPAPLVHGAFAGMALLGWPLTLLWLLALLSFPDGTRPGRRERHFVAAAFAVNGIVALGAYATASGTDLPAYLHGVDVPISGGPLSSATTAHAVLAGLDNLFLLVLPAVGVAALLVLRRRAGPVTRQQLKWLLPALALQLVVHLAFRTIADPWHGWRALAEVAVLAAPTVGAVAIGVAVFRYRLWEIDAAISKALVLALLSALVTAAFTVAWFGLALVVGGPDRRALTAVVVALTAVIVSQGPRRWSGRAVRRLVYGERPRGYAVLGGLGDSLAEAGSTTEVASRVVDAVRRGLAAPWAAVWLHVGGDGHGSLLPLAADGAGAGSLPLAPAAAASLVAGAGARHLDGVDASVGSLIRPLAGDGSAAVAPLVAGSELVGLLACGDRFRDPLGESDLELLGLLARDAALGLANRRLETELRLHVAELRRSRQRLVNAQDAERRRVERDLHDGVQAQLAALTAHLRRLASEPGNATADRLAVLAAEAEDSLFALQDLARGIYPPVLTDRGLPAAIRAQVARMPVDVRLTVDPALASDRLPADLEAALYFVALEALGNAQKHAAGAAVRADLRVEGRWALLDVSDGGPGFDTDGSLRPGSGLENMSDRMSAVGGTFRVTSTVARGSRVSAAAPLPAGWPS